MLDLFARKGVEMALLGRRVRATQEGSREVDCVPSETDGVGVETHQVALANDPFAGFPEVGEGVRSGLEQAGRDELAAAGDERSVELGPDLGFGAARCDGCVHVTDARLDAAHCFADDPELGRDLDLATRLEHWPRVDQLDATLAQGVGDEEVQPLDPQPGTRPARTSDVGGDLAGEGRDRLEITGTRGGRDARSAADLVDGRQTSGEVFAAGELEQHDRPGDRHEQEAARTHQPEDGHVPGTAAVHDVHRVRGQHRVDPMVGHHHSQPRQPGGEQIDVVFDRGRRSHESCVE